MSQPISKLEFEPRPGRIFKSRYWCNSRLQLMCEIRFMLRLRTGLDFGANSSWSLCLGAGVCLLSLA
jgi:hypothetical protein